MGAKLLVHAELVELRPGKERKIYPTFERLEFKGNQAVHGPPTEIPSPAGRTRKELTHRSILGRCLIRRDGMVVV